MEIVGIDLGGTNIKGVLIDETGKIIYQNSLPTDDNSVFAKWKDGVSLLFKKIKSYCKSDNLLVGLAAPGISNKDHSAISFMPGRMEGLEDFQWGKFLGQKNLFVLNDAHAALMAEASFGAGRGLKNLILLTLGTGVGGGLLIDGKLHTGKGLMAGHFGHITINSGSYKTGITGSPGTLEQAIGNTSLPERSAGRFNTTTELVDSHLKGDTFATYLWLDSLRNLALAICSISNSISPDAVIIGGGITNAGDTLFSPLNKFLDIYEWRPGGKKTPVLPAHYSDLSGAVGAAAFALSKKMN